MTETTRPTPKKAPAETYGEHKREAQECEAAERWQAAAEEWDAARRKSKDAPTRAEAKARRDAALTRAGMSLEELAAPPEKVARRAAAKPPTPAAVPDLPRPDLEVAEAARAARAGLRHGTELRHVARGVVKATCVWRGPRSWEFGGLTYTSISAAATAAGAALGMKSVAKRGVLNGWLFWGVETRQK